MSKLPADGSADPTVIPVVDAAVDYKQIPFGHGGLKTMRDMKG